MPHDPWLEPWLPQIRSAAAEAPVLELGCGAGADTVTLRAAGLAVRALDRDAEAVAQAQRRAPGAEVHCQDLEQPWPGELTGAVGAAPGPAYGVVLASLSLHYFPWDRTVALVQRVHATLRPGGLFLCRLNSTEDHHFGASGHAEIEPHYYRVQGAPKRFFDEADVDRLFAHGWQVLAKAHRSTPKYGLPKALWELALSRAPVGRPVAG
jgi:SAM-dependent methyltransferase